MNLIKKFYNDGAKEASASTKFNFPNETMDFEQLQVRPEETEEEVTEEKEEVVEDAKAEVKKDEKVEEVKEEKKVEPPPSPDWREVISKADPKEVYKHLQIDEDAMTLSKEIMSDEFFKKAYLYRKENGNLTPFIEAAGKDWDKTTPEYLIMDDLKKQYSHLSSDKAEKLAKADYNQRFVYRDDVNLSEAENQEMSELMALKLESEVEKIRMARKTEQKQFLDGIKPVDRKAETERLAKEQKEKADKEFTSWKTMVESNPHFKKISTDKQIVVGEKEKAFKWTVNPETIKEQTLDSNKFYNQFWKQEEGKEPVFNFELWSMVSAFSQNPQAFIDAVTNHGISKGQDKIVDELENKTPKSDNKTQIKKKSLATAVNEGQAFSFNGSEAT